MRSSLRNQNKENLSFRYRKKKKSLILLSWALIKMTGRTFKHHSSGLHFRGKKSHYPLHIHWSFKCLEDLSWPTLKVWNGKSWLISIPAAPPGSEGAARRPHVQDSGVSSALILSRFSPFTPHFVMLWASAASLLLKLDQPRSFPFSKKRQKNISGVLPWR